MLPARSLVDRSSAAERPAPPRFRRSPAGLALAALSLAAGCYLGDTGLPPPTDSFYYPTGIVVSPGRTALYVTNSDFDLQYNGGTVFALNLGELRARIGKLVGLLQCVSAERAATEACQVIDPGHTIDTAEKACAMVFLSRNLTSLLNPGPCSSVPLVRGDSQAPPNVNAPRAAKVMSYATIGAFASGAILVNRPAGDENELDTTRLFVPVRGDPSITFFDVVDDRTPLSTCLGVGAPEGCFSLDCNSEGDERRCRNDHRIGTEDDRYANSRGLTLPVEPVGIAASEDGDALVVAHQTQKAVSLSLNRGRISESDSNVRPMIAFTLSDLPDGPTEVATVPIPAYVKAKLANDPTFGYQPGFLVSYRAAGQVDLFRYTNDEQARPARAFLTRVFQAAITVNGDGKDSRGLAVDSSARDACQAKCAPDDIDCLKECLKTPLRIFLANRTPASLLMGKVETTLIENTPEGGGPAEPIGAFDTVGVDDATPLAFGASKVALGNVITPSGQLALRVFISAFDSRMVFSYDPEARRIDAVIRTGRGPHALAVDTGDDGDGTGLHSYLYVGHFTDSYLGVVDLDMRHPDTYGTMVASIGTPAPPRESK